MIAVLAVGRGVPAEDISEDAADTMVKMTKVRFKAIDNAYLSVQYRSLLPDLLDAPHRYIQAPSPPPNPLRSSSLGYMHPHLDREEPEVTRTTQLEALDRHGRPTTLTRRRRSRSRDAHGPRRQPAILRPGDEVIEIEHHRPMPTEDYDWYDRDGMRVRVREI